MNIRELKRTANERLRGAAASPTKLVAIHTGVTVALSLVLTVISSGMGEIGAEGGLSNMGTQSVIATIQVVLQLAYAVAQPFWAAGLIFAAMGLARQQTVTPGCLLEGFRRFRPIMVTLIWRCIQYFAVGFASAYLCSFLLTWIPLPQVFNDAAQQFVENPTEPMPDAVKMLMAAYMIVFVVVYGVLVLPIYYRYRAVEYLILDDPELGGLRAMHESRMLLRGKRLKLFRLDLSFWWFYLLDLLVSAVFCGDLILLALGVALPMSEMLAAWIFPIVGLACRFGLYVWAKPKMAVTYALYYDSLCDPEPEQPKQPPKMPWKY